MIAIVRDCNYHIPINATNLFFIPIFQNSIINRERQERESQVSKTYRYVPGIGNFTNSQNYELHLNLLLFVTIKFTIFWYLANRKYQFLCYIKLRIFLVWWFLIRINYFYFSAGVVLRVLLRPLFQYSLL